MELIKITEKDGQQLVSARELHEFLEIKDHFTQWIERMLEYGFNQSVDFEAVQIFLKASNGIGGTYKTDYALTLDCAKEISMLQRSDKGKQARQYFIACEKKLKQITTTQIDFTDPNVVLTLAQNWADENKRRLEAEKTIHLQAPKVAFAEAIVGSKNSILVGELAKLLHQNGVEIGQNRLFEWLRNKGYLCTIGEKYNQPSQYSLNLKIMEIKKTTYSKNDVLENSFTPKITPKGIEYFINKFIQTQPAIV